MDRLITLSDERLEKAKTLKGGYNAKQLEVLGVSWPPLKGWKAEVVDAKITLSNFIEFVRFSGNPKYINEIEALLPSLDPPVKYEK